MTEIKKCFKYENVYNYRFAIPSIDKKEKSNNKSSELNYYKIQELNKKNTILCLNCPLFRFRKNWRFTKYFSDQIFQRFRGKITS